MPRSLFRSSFLLLLVFPGSLLLAVDRSLDITEATTRFLAVNPRIRALSARVDIARAGIVGAGLRPNPTIDYEAQSLPERAGVTGSLQQAVKYSQPILSGGKLGARRRTAELEVCRSEAEVASEAFALVAELRRQFFRSRAARVLTEAQRASLERLSGIRRKLAARVKEGFASDYDRRRLEAESGQMELNVRGAEIQSKRQESLLAGLLGWRVEELPQPAGPLEPPQVAFPGLEVLNSHPEIREIDRQAELAASRLSLARQEAKSGISVFAGPLLYDQTALQSGFNAGVSIDLPMHDRRQGEKAEARARIASAASERQGALANLQSRLETAWNVYKAELARLEDGRRRLLTEPEGILDTVIASYAEGEHALVDLLDAYRLQRESHLSYIHQAEAARNALLDLEEAAGQALDVTHPNR